MSDFTSRMWKLSDRINEIEYTLAHLESAFSTTGNFHMADKLRLLSNVCHECSEEARNICSNKVADDLKDAQEQSRATTDLAMRIIKGEITLATSATCSRGDAESI